MREIKFRGVTHEFSSPSWVYGDLICDCTDEPRIMTDYHDCYEPVTWTVDPATVGQYTGLKDSEGEEIYEGDVIRAVTKNPYWGFKKNHAVEWDLDGFCLNGEPLYYWFNLHDLKVIGNVHDNSDLLEATHD